MAQMTLGGQWAHAAADRMGLAEALRDAHECGIEATRAVWYTTRRLLWHTYWRLEIEGSQNVPERGAVLLCANHTSHLDAPAILASLPPVLAYRTSTAAARDVFGAHYLKNTVSRVMTNSLTLDRSSEFAGGLRALERVLRERRPLILFPEGRRSPDGRMLEFKHGAAMLAVRTGTPVVPIHLDGLHECLARGSHLPLPGPVRVRFGGAIDPLPFRNAVESGRMNKHQAYELLTRQLRDSVAKLARD
jgi:1-acyl-sn-glycerol-3-phosphate acyltransferase